MVGPHLRGAVVFPDPGEPTGQSDRFFRRIESECTPDHRSIPDESGFQSGGLAGHHIRLDHEIMGPFFDGRDPLFAGRRRETGTLEREQGLQMGRSREQNKPMKLLQHPAADIRLSKPPSFHERQFQVLAKPLAADAGQEGHQGRT